MSAMKRFVGSWRFPSGNDCTARYERDRDGIGHIWFEWDSPPPLSAGDNRFYQAVVLPSVVRLIESLNLKGGQYDRASA